VETVVMRILAEVHSGCVKKAHCTPDPHVCGCPEGFACDKRRLPREGRAKVGGFLVGHFGGAALGMSLPVLGGALVGLMIGGPAGAAALAGAAVVSDFVLPTKIAGGMIGGRVGRTEILPTCQCFPLICAFDKKVDSCIMRPSHYQNRSANVGFPLLPLNGMKCTVSRKSTFRKRSICSLQACQDTDALVPGPLIPSGQRLFGRVGTRDQTVFNCANTNGKVDTLIMLSEKLPDYDVRGLEVNNTVKARKEMLRRFPNVQYQEVGWEEKKHKDAIEGNDDIEEEDDRFEDAE